MKFSIVFDSAIPEIHTHVLNEIESGKYVNDIYHKLGIDNDATLNEYSILMEKKYYLSNLAKNIDGIYNRSVDQILRSLDQTLLSVIMSSMKDALINAIETISDEALMKIAPTLPALRGVVNPNYTKQHLIEKFTDLCKFKSGCRVEMYGPGQTYLPVVGWYVHFPDILNILNMIKSDNNVKFIMKGYKSQFINAYMSAAITVYQILLQDSLNCGFFTMEIINNIILHGNVNIYIVLMSTIYDAVDSMKETIIKSFYAIEEIADTLNEASLNEEYAKNEKSLIEFRQRGDA